MLAPRKSLWSTPIEVIDKAIEQLNITSNDIVYDIGAGKVFYNNLTNFYYYSLIFLFK